MLLFFLLRVISTILSFVDSRNSQQQKHETIGAGYKQENGGYKHLVYEHKNGVTGLYIYLCTDYDVSAWMAGMRWWESGLAR